MKNKLLMVLVIIAVFSVYLIPVSIYAVGTDYYIDYISGSDSNNGTSASTPWRTFDNVNSTDFQPGDTIHLKKGCTWNQELVINDSGTEANPITVETYGTGSKPVIINPSSSEDANSVSVYGDWIIIDGIKVEDSRYAGVEIKTDADNNIVRNIEAVNVGLGVSVWGQYNLVTNNYIHDLKEVVNTPYDPGVPGSDDDDYGCVGVWLWASNNEVSYNRIIDCVAQSYDYGIDGGGIEFFGTVDNCKIHHNFVKGCMGFIEIGGDKTSLGGSAKKCKYLPQYFGQ